MSIFKKQKSGISVDSYLNYKKFVTLEVFKLKSVGSDMFNNPEHAKNTALLAQCINYLLGEDIDGGDGASSEIKAYIEEVRDTVPLMASKLMEDITIYNAIISVLLMQEQIYIEKLGNGYSKSKVGGRTKNLLDLYNPNRNPADENELAKFMKPLA